MKKRYRRLEKIQTLVTLSVDITYEVVEDGLLPDPMFELIEARCDLIEDGQKTATVNVLKVLDESQRMLIEDEILEWWQQGGVQQEITDGF